MSAPENTEKSGLVLMSDGAKAVSDVCLRTADVSWVLQKSLQLSPERQLFALPLLGGSLQYRAQEVNENRG